MKKNKHSSVKIIFVQFLIIILIAGGMSACKSDSLTEKTDGKASVEPVQDVVENIIKSPGQIWLDKIEAIRKKEWKKEYCQKNSKHNYTVKFSEPVLVNDTLKGEYKEIVTYEHKVVTVKYNYEMFSENQIKLIRVTTDISGKEEDWTDTYNRNGNIALVKLDLLDNGNMLVLDQRGSTEIYVAK